MKQKTKSTIAIVLGAILLISGSANAQRFMENIDRGVVAVRISSSKVYVGWRMFGTDPNDIAFNLYRNNTKVNSAPITNSTNYMDNSGSSSALYHVRTVINGEERKSSKAVEVWDHQYFSIPIEIPAGGTTPDGVSYIYNNPDPKGNGQANDCSVGDLDGDGEYEIVLKWDPSNSKDNEQDGYTGNVYLDAYEMDGTHLWRIDLGINIRAGAHYTQFMVYDLDSDGKAEVACKTAPGTIDGQDNYVILPGDDPNADYRSTTGATKGKILSGPEYLTIFDGQTGAAIATTSFYPDRVNANQWGDSYGNRVDRFLAAIAYLDGQRPSLIMARGYYGPQYSWGQARNEITAWNWRNGILTRLWWFKAGYNINDNINIDYIGQGNHNLSIGDVDGDGKDEIVYGACAIDDDGTGLYTTGLGHGDAMHLSDMDPDRPGLEVFDIHEYASHPYGVEFRDAGTGEPIWGKESPDAKRGLAIDIDPRYKGYEMWAFGEGLTGVWSVTGAQISTSNPSSCNFGVWWDGDLLREILDGSIIDKWNYSSGTTSRLLTAYHYDAEYNNWTKKNPGLSADILGDWREEVIWRTYDSERLLVFTTTTLTNYRFYTLMHDPQYRLSVAWQNVGYNQPPHTSFYMGDGMAEPPRPDIRVVYGDLISDGIVDTEDLSEFVDSWLVTDCNNVRLDWNGDCIINLYEFSLLARNWLEGI
jgi:rhamnogalacturonan endolyase